MASRPTRRRVYPREVGFRKCTSQKVGYSTKVEALDAAELQMLEGKVQPGCHIVPYLCRVCHEWHTANRVLVRV